ncbi:MAG TPA: CBS domain-containing protein [Ktedonobacteraceae bacterium]|jgi:CBS domain-containing protein/sporulation protein YlmC with PRC-barrel domain|nr:CBS domain-containing protein [Ktedonobacteraceae bacterium]
MFYLSQLLGTPVEDLQGERVGKVIDVVVPAGEPAVAPSALSTSTSTAASFPATFLIIEGLADEPTPVPITDVERHGNAFRLRLPVEQLLAQNPQLPGDTICLAQDVLDKQVIDLEHKKAVRVNDLYLSDDWRVLGVDNTTFGLMRRLVPARLLGGKGKQPSSSLIPWNEIEVIGSQTPVTEEEAEPPVQPHISKPLRAQSGQLAELRPADIADIVHQLTPGQGARLLEGLDNETAADALEEIDTDRQSHILENIDLERAADILDAMGPDEAADLLARLPEERAEQLLRLMQPEESEDVQELLEYGEDTAGGLMTTDYIALNANKSVAEALEAVRFSIREQDIRTTYIYCVPDETQDECKLLGVVSLWDILIADPAGRLEDLMKTDLITVEPDSDPEDVAEIMAKYNLLAVPVVNSEGILEGIVTVDDALDILLPEERKRKPRRMY